jgi:hypothetical protein
LVACCRTCTERPVVLKRLLAIAFAMMTCPVLAHAGVRRIWIVNDGEKIERDAVAHPAAARNSAWDGRTGHIFGARNEIVAFQLIVEADRRGVHSLSVKLPALSSAADRIVYRAPAIDPTDYVDRPIEIFTEHYMDVTTPSHASWVYDRDSPAAPSDPTGWKPVQLVPENARAGRGGFPVTVRPSENQAIWVDIYIDRSRLLERSAGAVSRPQSRSRLSSPRPSLSRRIRASLRRADAAARHRSVHRG